MLHTLLFSATLVAQAAQDVPLFEGTGPYTRSVTQNALAQKYFDQGLNMLYAFHHQEAKRSFRKAASLDPQCAMAWWGVATANGPHVNMPMVPPDDEKEAYEAIQRARKLSAKPSDKALIEATVARFKWPQPADRGPLDRAYAAAMRKVAARYPGDADVTTLFAESLMDLSPWNYWLPGGKPKPATVEVIRALRQALKKSPDHPGALHLTIHALEASNRPEDAVAAADRLRYLQPGLGHNVHMPSHIDVRVGAWQKAIDANQRAMDTDANYRAKHNPAPVYRFYMAHNNHMQGFAAMMIGQRAVTLKAMEDLVTAIPAETRQAMGALLDGYFVMPMEARVRFGLWDEVLETPDFEAGLPLSRAMWSAARAVAYAAKGMTKEARAEQAEFYKRRREVPAEAVFGQNKSSDILIVTTHLMNGEILVAEGSHDAAIERLKTGIIAEDKLRYSEPPDWIQPIRHTLGALLVRMGRYDEAVPVYREDLKRLPNNGWSLYGLSVALENTGKSAEAKKHRDHFNQVWAKADTEITSSCLCIPGK